MEDYKSMKKDELIALLEEQGHLKEAVEAKDLEINTLKAKQNDRSEIEKLKKEHKDTLEKQVKEFEKTLAGTNDAANALQKFHEKELETLKHAHKEEIAQIIHNNETSVADLTKQLKDQEAKHTKDMIDVQQYVNSEFARRNDLINRLVDMYAALIKTMQGTTDAHAQLFANLNGEVGKLNGGS